MPTGNDYEIFVQKLQQALINSEKVMSQKNVKIERNKKIKDNSGITREFDLYWEYELAGVTYKTIIECKDYASRVSIDRIDTLIGKVRDIPDLKPIFATKTGYQSGAKQKQKTKNNKVDLLIVCEQRDDEWEDKEGNPLIKDINVNIQLISPARITNFKPFIDGDWLKYNSKLNLETKLVTSSLNTEIFIEDVARNDTYSLLELATRLEKISSGSGEHTHSELFKDAYLINNGLRLKLCKYEVDYCIKEPTNQTMQMDFSKELVAVIKYLHKDSTTAIFKDKIIKDWMCSWRCKLSNQRSTLEKINIFCTLIIVVITCISSYFSFQSIQLATNSLHIANSQEEREERQEAYQLLKLAFDIYETKSKQKASKSLEKNI